jgi:hypothetical protein
MLIDKVSAMAIARTVVGELANSVHDSFEIIPEATKDINEGWLFFYNTVDFVRTQNPIDSLAGNGPILVRRNGQVHHIPSSVPLEIALKNLA